MRHLRFFLRRNRLFLVFLCGLVLGCGSALKEDVSREREKVEKLLLDFYARDYPLVLFPFTNQTRRTNFAYLEEALPETVFLVLQSLEKDYTLVDGKEYIWLRGFPFALEDKILSAKVPSWESYKTLSSMVITQVQVTIETNKGMISTNRFTNITTTNIFRFLTNRYDDFLEKEFPGLIEALSRFSFSWRLEKPQPKATNLPAGVGLQPTNTVLPDWVYEGRVYGRFSVEENKMGPSAVTVTLVLLKLKAFTTNQQEIVIRTTEDKLYEEILRQRGQIRRFYLEGDLVDMEVLSEPEDANIYLNGVYIGRTPIVYEGVRPGNHTLQFVKEGFETVSYRAKIQKGGTNVVRGVLQPREMTGSMTLTGESNRLVFLDSLYVGLTPLVISNISLVDSHMLLIRSEDRNYEDIYYSFSLTREKPDMVFVVGRGEPLARRQWRKNIAWGLCYGSWGLTIGFMGAHFYTSALRRYYEDQLYNPLLTDAQRDAYASQVAWYGEWQQRLFTYGILSSLVSMGLTAYGLSEEEIYLVYDSLTGQWGLGYSARF
ncbi:MAG: PEGA domain-containing protein [Brevinematales bacterium]